MTTFDRNLSGSRARETLSECKELHKKRGRHPIQLLYEDFFEQSYVCLIKKKKKRGRHPIQLLYEDFFEQSYVCLIKK